VDHDVLHRLVTCTYRRPRDTIAIAVAVAEPERSRGRRLIDLTVAVLVLTIALLCGARMHAAICVITVRVAEHIARRHIAADVRRSPITEPITVRVRVGREQPHGVIVDDSIAVLVHAVAGLDRAWMDGCRTVIVVGHARTVVVGAVAHLFCPWMSTSIGVVAVETRTLRAIHPITVDVAIRRVGDRVGVWHDRTGVLGFIRR